MAYNVGTNVISWSQHTLENMIISGNSVILQPGYLVPITLDGLTTELLITNIPIDNETLFQLLNNKPGLIALFGDSDILTLGLPILSTVSSWISPSAIIQAVIPPSIINNGSATLYMEVNPPLNGSLQSMLSEPLMITLSSITLGNFGIMGYLLTGSLTTPIIDTLLPGLFITLSLSLTLTQGLTIDINNSFIEQIEYTGSMDQPTTPTIGQFTDPYGGIHNYWLANSFGTVTYGSTIVDNPSSFGVPYRFYQLKFQLNQETPAILLFNNLYYTMNLDGTWNPNAFINLLSMYSQYNNYIINHIVLKILINRAFSNSLLMNLIANSSALMNLIANSMTWINLIVSSSTLMNLIANSATLMNLITNSTTWINLIVSSSTLMNLIANSVILMNLITNSTALMNLIVSSSTLMNLIVNSSTLINLIVNSTVLTQYIVSTNTFNIVKSLPGEGVFGYVQNIVNGTYSLSNANMNNLLVLLAANNGNLFLAVGESLWYPFAELLNNKWSGSEFGFTEYVEGYYDETSLMGSPVLVPYSYSYNYSVASNQILFVVHGWNSGASGCTSVNGIELLCNSSYPNSGASPLVLSPYVISPFSQSSGGYGSYGFNGLSVTVN